MRKIMISILTAAMAAALSVPMAFAANSDFAGGIYTANDGSDSGYATLTIFACDDEHIIAGFERVKSNETRYTFELEDGVMDGNKASMAYTAVSSTNQSFSGTMEIELLSSGDIYVACPISGSSESLYNGTFKKTGSVVSAEPVTGGTNSPDVLVNGETVEFPDDARPEITDDRTYIPLRSTLNAMGINVYWDEYEQSNGVDEQFITCTSGDEIVQFSRTKFESGATSWSLHKWEEKYSSSDDFSDLTDLIVEMQPKLIGEYSYIPLRVTAETFGADVEWDGDNNRVLINYDKENKFQNSPELIAQIEDFTFEMAKESANNNQYFEDADGVGMPYYAPAGKFYIIGANLVEDGDSVGTKYLRVFVNDFFDGPFSTFEGACAEDWQFAD